MQKSKPARQTPTSHIRVKISVPKSVIRDYILRAGISHWGVMQKWKSREMRLILVERGEGEAQKHVEIRPERWAIAIGIMAVKFPLIFAELMNRDGDKFTGDLLVQLAAFGEHRYA